MADAYSYIRFSTPEQAAGDSWRRQRAAIERFVSERNLTLRDSKAFEDLGVSSYRGANLRRGLGQFISEVDSGKVKKGSYLIVESIDRLSRQGVFDSLSLLISLIDKGIHVVTLDDSGVQVLDKTAGYPALVVTLFGMFRAHGESATKSVRLDAAWANKKANAANKPVTTRCPEWLRFSEAEGKFVEVPERVDTVRKIFELADAGMGRYRIVKYLNQNGFKSFRNEANGWQSSSVAKLLKNRSVIGYYQPHKIFYDDETGRKGRRPDGDEVPEYYPTVVDVDLFRRVSMRHATRSNPVRGRQGQSLSNLFTGLAVCHWCGSAMTLQNKGVPPKGDRYLVCSLALRGKGCRYRSWRYDDFEVVVLTLLREINYADVLGDVEATQEVVRVRNELASALENVSKTERVLANLEATFDEYEGKIPMGMVRRYEETELKLVNLRAEVEVLRQKEGALAVRVSDPAAFGAQLLALYRAMDQASDTERHLLRLRLRERLCLLLTKIQVKAVAKDEQLVDGVPNPRAMTLHFANGTRRVIVPVGDHDVFSMDTGSLTEVVDAAPNKQVLQNQI